MTCTCDPNIYCFIDKGCTQHGTEPASPGNSELLMRLKKLLPELEFGRGTHIQWRDCPQIYREKNPDIGDIEFHQKCVDTYDERIATIKDAITFIEGVAQ